jgi:short subunit dehydrogenase-like uncharacterized protein
MKRYDIILYGATGFTGQRAAAYLQEHAPMSVRWAIAGRSEAKLLALKKELNLSVDALIADAMNAVDIDILVQQTEVLITTVGPYALYGSELVKNCSKYGVHYVDITGESPWVRDMLDEYGEIAQATKAKIIPFCGFDSIPADLGVWFLQKYMRETWESELTSAEGYYTLSGGGLNGGTLLSALNMLEKGEEKRLGNPKLLTKDLKHRNFIPKVKNRKKNHYAEDIKKWVYPFFMAEINTKVVYRSIGLAAEYHLPHPEQFIYEEYHAIGKRIPALIGTLGMASFGALGQFGPFRKMVKKFGPSAGEGPKETEIEEGFFKLRIVGADKNGNRGMMTLQYKGDAGNKATTCFLCECALALSLDKDRLPAYSGFLTPSIALGSVLLERLIVAGLEIGCETL